MALEYAKLSVDEQPNHGVDEDAVAVGSARCAEYNAAALHLPNISSQSTNFRTAETYRISSLFDQRAA